jgi:hypothetical protein
MTPTIVDTSTLPPTEKQVAYLRSLVERGDSPVGWSGYRDDLASTGRWTRRGLSDLIDRLLSGDASEPTYVAPNRHAGPCGCCGDPVLPGEGRAERVGDRWCCYHSDCETTEPTTPPVGYHFHEPSGRTVEVLVSKGGRTYYRVLSPERGWETDRSVDWDAALDATTTLDVAKAESLGRATGRCVLCGRTLRRPESIRDGMGPDCRAKLAEPSE